MATTIQLRRDTAANWTTSDPILLEGEVGIETDTNKLKMGDGTTLWSVLAYFADAGGASGSLDQPTNLTPTNGQSSFSLNLPLTTSAPTGTDFHTHTIWIIYSDAGGTTEVYNSGAIADRTSHIIPASAGLQPATQYWWTVQYVGLVSTSTVGALTSFTVAINFAPYFSTDFYTGNGGTLNVVTDVDVTENGGMVWLKSRFTTNVPVIYDTVRGATFHIIPSTTSPESTTPTGLTAFNADGFTVGTWTNVNISGGSFVSWNFTRKLGFFDVVTYTGTGVTGLEVPILLEDGLATFGMALVRNLDDTNQMYIQHRSLPPTELVRFTTSILATSDATIFPVNATTSTLTVGNALGINTLNDSHVAYLFAHNPAKGIFCGSYTGTGASGNSVVTGFPVGWLMIKRTDATAAWVLVDSERGGNNYLVPDASDIEATIIPLITFNTDGFTVDATVDTVNVAAGTYIFMAIADPTLF